MVTLLSIGYFEGQEHLEYFLEETVQDEHHAEMTCCAACVAALIQHLEYYLQVTVQDKHHAEVTCCTACVAWM